MPDENQRSRIARAAAESALVRVAHHYGSRPEFVLLGGLVPELLCTLSDARHAGTTDVDVQVGLEIAHGAAGGQRLERALRNAEFEPDTSEVWRWRTDRDGTTAVVKFELLADRDDIEAGATLRFDDCEALGAVNLRGTGFAARDVVVHELTARVGDDIRRVEINTTGLRESVIFSRPIQSHRIIQPDNTFASGPVDRCRSPARAHVRPVGPAGCASCAMSARSLSRSHWSGTLRRLPAHPEWPDRSDPEREHPPAP